MSAKFRQIWAVLLRLGFRLLYQEMAWSYDAVSWLVSFGAWRDWQRASLPYVNGPAVLEIGHGPGHMLLALNALGYQVTGLDLSPQMGIISRRRLINSGYQASLLRGMAQAVPFQAGSFDTVLATFPTEYLVAEESIAAIHQVLRENGRLIVVPQARFSGSGLAERFVEWLYVITGQRPESTMPDELGIENEFPFWDQIGSRFQEAGFVLVIEKVRLEGSEVTVIVAQKR